MFCLLLLYLLAPTHLYTCNCVSAPASPQMSTTIPPSNPLWQTASFIFSIRVIPLIAFPPFSMPQIYSPLSLRLAKTTYRLLRSPAISSVLHIPHSSSFSVPSLFQSLFALSILICPPVIHLHCALPLIPFLVHQPTTTWQAPQSLTLSIRVQPPVLFIALVHVTQQHLAPFLAVPEEEKRK